ncbi:hypothetical protein HYPSUDRAFT_52572 [Hypholoma sublateritium FD-334 SS-4]|uniref:G domain-containing protein n=1 Tax=Hypholoma sublateritium (strain FD-334 SS-4) TaxID=945553 RepID=A0A0D2P5S1_HYPSF|nr:hypothetical protein HYPSUDRAFT_52572 [Hypholoma sublateritium FD-334 SS-4]
MATFTGKPRTAYVQHTDSRVRLFFMSLSSKLKNSNVSESDLQRLPVIMSSLCQFIGTADPHLRQKPEVGHSLESCTKEILPFKVKNTISDVEGRSVILVDTPGYDDSDPLIRDQDRLEIIIKWLKSRPGLKLNGIIVLHDITLARIADNSSIVAHAAMPHPPNVTFVTTKWPSSKPYPKEYEEHEAELQSLLSRAPKVEVKRFDNSAQSVWKIIDDVSPPSGVKSDPRQHLITQLESILNRSKMTVNAKEKRTNLNSILPIASEDFQNLPAIMLLGQTGCGKSSFINVADPHLDHKPQVSDMLASCTKVPQEFKVKNPSNPQKSVILVDTPGLNDSDPLHGDRKQLGVIIDWLKKRPNMKFAGVFYLYDITETRIAHPLRKVVNTVQKEKKDSRSPQTIFLTTKWTSTDFSLCRSREEELRDYLPEGTMKRFNGSADSAWEIIGDICTPPNQLSAQKLWSQLENIRDSFLPAPGENIIVKFFMESIEWIKRP